MASFDVHPSLLNGHIRIPPSKSHTMRAIIFAAIAKGKSHIENYLPSPDTMAMIEAVRQFGAEVLIHENHLEINGFAGKPKCPEDVIHCGNAGQVLRFISAFATLLPTYTVLTGDHSIRNLRPMQPLLDGLTQLGAFATSSRNNGHAPVIIKGPITKKNAFVDGEDSQPISALLMACAFAPHPTEVHVKNPGERPWIDLTLHWFKQLNIPYTCHDYVKYQLLGNAEINAFHYSVPGDFSTAAFPIVAALVTKSPLTLHNLNMNDCQGDKAILPLLERMGASFKMDLQCQSLQVNVKDKLQGVTVDINNIVDALPILAVLGCFAEGRTEIVNAGIARKKESDRIHCITKELRKMGARIEEKSDGLVIEYSPLMGAELNTYHDHRLALALVTAALAAKSPSKILGIECINKTYHCFYEDFRSIGAKIEL